MKSESPKIAVILCGGKGSRMGSLTKKIPKPLLKIHGKPIIWYSIKMLALYNFNKIIFPLGYKGEKIKNYINQEFPKMKNKFFFVNTGINSSVSKRMHLIKNLIPDENNFFMLHDKDHLSTEASKFISKDLSSFLEKIF